MQLTTALAEAVPVDAHKAIGYEVIARRFVIWVDGEEVTAVDLSDRVSEDSWRVRTIRIGYGLAVQQVMDPLPDASTITTFVFDDTTGELLAELATPNEDMAVPIGPNRLALGDVDFSARITDLEGLTIHRIGRFGHAIAGFALAENGDLLVGLADGSIHRHDAETLELEQSLIGPPAAILQILPFEGGFVTSHFGGEVVKWYDGEDRPAGTIHGPAGLAGFSAVSLDETEVFVPEPGRVVRVPLGRAAFIAEACRRAGSEVDRQAWSAVTATDPAIVEELCAESLAE